DATRQRVTELDEVLQASRAELAAIGEPADSAIRLGRRLSAAGWASLLDAVSAPEDSWPAIEAVAGGELEGARLWGDGDPTEQLDGARGAARLLAAGSAPEAGDRDAALAAVDATRTLAEWVGAPEAPLAFHRTVVAANAAALVSGWSRLPSGWSAVT